MTKKSTNWGSFAWALAQPFFHLLKPSSFFKGLWAKQLVTGNSWWQPWVFCCSFSKLNKSSKGLMFTCSCLTMPLIVNSSRSTWLKYMEWSEWWRSQTSHPAAHVSLLTELNSGSSWIKQQRWTEMQMKEVKYLQMTQLGVNLQITDFSVEKLWKLVPLAPRFTQAETGCAKDTTNALMGEEWEKWNSLDSPESGEPSRLLSVRFKKPKCWNIELIGKSWITSKSSKRRLMIYSLRQKCSERLYAMKSNDGTIFTHDKTWYFIGPIWANLNVSAGNTDVQKVWFIQFYAAVRCHPNHQEWSYDTRRCIIHSVMLSV